MKRFYAGASILMKLSAHSGNLTLLALIIGLLALTAVSEIMLLKQIDLSTAYIAIIAAETILVIGFAVAIGEHLSPREIIGGAFVIAGTLLVSL